MATFKQDQCVQHVGNQSHLSRLSSGLNLLRQQAAFCDVNIIVGDHRFPAHKAVLSCTSDYFQGMFLSGFQESTMGEITVPGSEESFAQILDFAYTGYFTLSLRTVTGILQMACYMVVTEAMDLCAEYLREVKDNFPIEDCFEIWSIASNHSNLSDVAQLYRSHLVQNFYKCVQSKVFLENSSTSVMLEILSDEEIETDTMTEEQILQAALIWLKFDWEQRKVHAFDLLKKIRLGLVPVDSLRDILGDEILAIPECKVMMEEVVMLSFAMDTASPPLINSHPEWFATRNTITAGLVDDCSDFSSSAPIIQLTCKTKTACYKMTNLADIPNRYPYSRLKVSMAKPFVSNENQLYATIYIAYSGQDDEDKENHHQWFLKNNFFQYISEKNEWIMLPPRPEILEYPRMLMFQIKEYIYLIGNVCDEHKSAIQRFSILSKSWELVLNDILFRTSDAILLPAGQILVTGEQLRAGPTQDCGVGDDGGFSAVIVALYKPATNELLDVSVDTTLEKNSYFMEYNNTYYLITDEEQDQVKRSYL
ncbi:uncharacterized protein [Amphiura filiformis]|uniref:uncharacterized protein n=1 Tax=Amphiura filiformis TaxID=82378 RepID=UPI003B20FD35